MTATSQLFKEKEVRLEARLPQRVPRLVADGDRITQVIYNLLSNAVKFCETGRGRVEVALVEDAGFLRVDVSDNGPGIRPQDQRVIFDKFRQAGDALTDKPRGTGLGLHISLHIVRHCGGRIWVSSRPGQGTTFSFTLPLARVAAPADAS